MTAAWGRAWTLVWTLAWTMAAALAFAPAAVADPLEVPGRLSDADFYRAVSCGAPPGGACAHPARRWQTETAIRVALRPLSPAFAGRRKIRAEAALTRALQDLNGAGAGFRLAQVGARDPAEITLHFLGISAGEQVAGTGLDWVDGAVIGAVSTRLATDPDGTTIRAAAVLVATSLDTADYEAAVLSALTAALGLTTALASPAYDGRSALARSGPTPTRLAAQDAAALRMHYGGPAQ